MARSFDITTRSRSGSGKSGRAAAPRSRRAIWALARSLAAAACMLTAGLGLFGPMAGCTLGLPQAVSDIRYDFGPAPADLASNAGALPPIRLFDVRAPRALETDDILYRMSYADPRQTAAYANSHWTMRPAQLLSERVRHALAAHGAVLGGGQAAQAPQLTIDLEQFEQVFDSEGQSHGALTARATLLKDGKVIAQRTFVARAPASMPNAAGGAHALATASDQFAAQLATWLGIEAGALTQ